MDVNRTRFHLLFGCEDWSRCQLAGTPPATSPPGDGPATLGWLWDEGLDPPLEWDAGSASLRLTRSVPLFRRSGRQTPLAPGARRGAGRDQYGNWYWIDDERSGLLMLPRGSTMPARFWTSADLAARCQPQPPGEFAVKQPTLPPVLELGGLAITSRHFLVVGDVTQHGLLVFDLHGGGVPLLVRWPDETPFEPWDLAPTAEGGLLVLDRENLTYWVLDENFRLLAETAQGEEDVFQPVGATRRRRSRPMVSPQGYALAGGSPPGSLWPVSIEPGPGGTVLIMDTDPERAYSIIYEMQGAQVVAAYSLEDAAGVMDPSLGEGVIRRFSVAGHDFAFGSGPVMPKGPFSGVRPTRGCSAKPIDESAGEGEPPPLLYVAERDGLQVMAFALDRENGRLVEQAEYLPLRRWQAKALVAVEGQVYYDFADRWVTLQPLMDCQYAGQAAFTTPVDFRPDLPGGPFDGGELGCVWHRLMLDAIIPAGTSIAVRARAADDPELLGQVGWSGQPTPYLRGDGAELPYFDPWVGLSQDDGQGPALSRVEGPERAGTWELLFQGIKGRYLQLELTFIGTGRSTPVLRALRAWYPRFSYLERYLPAIYREDPVSAPFTERWLANFEGVFTALEERIEHVSALFDPRSAPVETLDWLACWFGVVLDPLWPEERRRFFIRYADRLYRQRGTLPGVEIALRLYLEDNADQSLFDLLCLGRSRVRIVEHFRTRGIGGLVYGDPTKGGTQEWRPLTRADVAESAHRFSVLIPHDLTIEQLEMVRRIVELEKPAHTAYEIKRYWDMFRAGEARLGVDTRLGMGSRFTPLLLSEGYLPDHYLPAPYPFDIPDRIISDRDRLGDLPAL